MIDKDLTTEEFIHLFGLEALDDNELSMIKSLLYSINISTKEKHFSAYSYQEKYATIAMYNQNYLFLKHMLNLEEQNKQIIDLLTQIVRQNHSILKEDNDNNSQNITEITLNEIKKLEELINLGILSQEEFEKKKKELLNL